jgi:serine/threonine protein kinase
LRSASDASLTKTSGVMGSPMYLSPEQLRSSRDVDARADIWALGSILHELLMGSLPFAARRIDLPTNDWIHAQLEENDSRSSATARGRAPEVDRVRGV